MVECRTTPQVCWGVVAFVWIRGKVYHEAVRGNEALVATPVRGKVHHESIRKPQLFMVDFTTKPREISYHEQEWRLKIFEK